jgi:hypothetical protein
MAAGSGVPRPGAGVRAADRDGPVSLRTGGLDAVTAGAAHCYLGDEAPAGKFSRNEILAGDTGSLGMGFQGWGQ